MRRLGLCCCTLSLWWRKENSTLLVLAEARQLQPLPHPHSPSLYVWTGTAFFVIYVCAGCWRHQHCCSVHKAASQEDWGKKIYAKKKKKSFVISKKQQGHITTCNGKPQRNASETDIFFFKRQLNHLTSTRDGLTRTNALLIQLLYKIMSKQQ